MSSPSSHVSPVLIFGRQVIWLYCSFLHLIPFSGHVHQCILYDIYSSLINSCLGWILSNMHCHAAKTSSRRCLSFSFEPWRRSRFVRFSVFRCDLQPLSDPTSTLRYYHPLQQHDHSFTADIFRIRHNRVLYDIWLLSSNYLQPVVIRTSLSQRSHLKPSAHQKW